MPIDRATFDQLQHMLRPISNRIGNTVARGVVQLVNDGKQLQLVQLGVLDGETVEGAGGAEHYQPYGLSSVPLEGAESVIVFPNGDRGHPLVVVISDRRSRPTGGEPGDVTLYNAAGAMVRMLATGDIELQPAPGREVLVRDEGGTVERLVKKGEFDAHVHATAGTGTPSPPTVPAVGTQRLRAQ